MRSIQTPTRGGVWRTSRALYGGRTRCRFQHTGTFEPNSNKPPPLDHPPREVGDVIQGLRGDRYKITQASGWKPKGPLCRTYQATKWEAGLKETFLLKELRRPSQVRHLLGVNQMLQQHPNLQTLYDAAPYERLLIYRPLPYHVASLIRDHPEIEYEARKEILKRALTGLVALHDQNLAHLNIKPAAILADYGSRLGSSSKNNVHKVQLGRFEDAILPYLSKERIDQYRVSIEDLPWKSPEFWIRALQTRPSDVFSFGLTSVNFMLNNLKLLCPDTGFQLKRLAALGGIGRGVPTPSLLAKLQIWFNYFGDADALMGLLEQVKDEPNRWYGPLSKHVKESAFGTRKPLPGLGNHHDPGFVDVVTKMTHLDPRKRITAREALEHEWFANITVGPEHVWFSPFIPLKQPDTREALDTVQNGLPMRKIPTEPQHIPIRSFPAYTPPISDDPSTPLQEDEGESAVLKVAREDGEKHLPPAKNVIRKVYTPLNESALERYRNFAGRGPNPATLRKRVFKLEKPEPLAIPIKEINRF